jgi:hypothetical protein
MHSPSDFHLFFSSSFGGCVAVCFDRWMDSDRCSRKRSFTKSSVSDKGSFANYFVFTRLVRALFGENEEQEMNNGNAIDGATS